MYCMTEHNDLAERVALPSIVTKAATLAVACGKTVRITNTIAQRYHGAGLIISSIAHDLASVQCVWDFVQALLRRRMCQGDMDQEVLLRLNRTIHHGREIIHSLNEDLSLCVRLATSNSEHSFRQRTRIVRNERRWRNHQDRIRGQMISMNLLISILRS